MAVYQVLLVNRHLPRDAHRAALGAAFVLAMTASMSYVLLDRADGFVPWLKYVVVVAGAGAAFLIVLHRLLPRRAMIAVARAAVITMLAGPTAYAIDAASTPHIGSIPSAGPNTGGFAGGGPGGMARLGWALLRGRVPLAEVAGALGRTTARSAGGRLSAQMVVFALIAILSTLAYGVLYVALRGRLGAQEANALALAATAIDNTAANRRFTFGFRGPKGRCATSSRACWSSPAGWA